MSFADPPPPLQTLNALPSPPSLLGEVSHLPSFMEHYYDRIHNKRGSPQSQSLVEIMQPTTKSARAIAHCTIKQDASMTIREVHQDLFHVAGNEAVIVQLLATIIYSANTRCRKYNNQLHCETDDESSRRWLRLHRLPTRTSSWP